MKSQGEPVCDDVTAQGVVCHLKAADVCVADIDPECLDLAGRAADRLGQARTIRLCRASADRLPLADSAVDLAWCAQSLGSLPKTIVSLRAIGRVVRPGVIAVIENDSLHDLLLPWPVELELEIYAAEWNAHAVQTEAPTRYYIGRWLCTLFQELGLSRLAVPVWATTRQPPLTADERHFLAVTLNGMRRRTEPYLSASARPQLTRLAASPTYNRLSVPAAGRK